MKVYKSKEYKLFNEEIEIMYDTINNFTVEIKDYLAIINTKVGADMTRVKLRSYFIADDENGIGLCTELYADGDKARNITYYSDEEWASVFASGIEFEYYDDFSKCEDIRNIINYNISCINEEVDYQIIPELNDIKIRDKESNLIGIAKECTIIENEKLNNFTFVLNKVITGNFEKLNIGSLSIENGDNEFILWNSMKDYGCRIKEINEVILCDSRELVQDLHFRLFSINKSENEPTIDYDYDDSQLDFTYKEKKEFAFNEDVELTEERREGLKMFNDYYRDVFKKEINIIKYLLN